jgi:hypothetical protein
MEQPQLTAQQQEALNSVQSQAKTDPMQVETNSETPRVKKRKSAADGDQPKKKRRTIYTTPNDKELVFKVDFSKFTNGVSKTIAAQTLSDFNKNPLGMVMTQLENGQVKIGPTAAEQKKQKSDYRKSYRIKPTTIKKNLEKANDPKEIQKRKDYAMREDVKLKKAQAAKEGRRVRALLKRNDPEKYLELLAQARQQEAQHDSTSTSSSSEDSSSDEDTVEQE